VRQISQVRDLATFRRFLALLASRTGQLLNKTDLAAPLGISVPTVAQWIGILETTGQVIAVPPYFESFGKRLVKSPKPPRSRRSPPMAKLLGRGRRRVGRRLAPRDERVE